MFLSQGGGTEQLPAPCCRPRCAGDSRQMSCVKAGKAREVQPCSELFWSEVLTLTLLWSSSVSQQAAASPALWGLVLFLIWLEK